MPMKDMTPAQMLDAAMEGALDDVLDDGEQQQVEQSTTAAEPQTKQAQEYPEGTPIASKSGAYSIPYDELVKARDRAKEAELEAQQLRAQLQDLTAKQQANLAAAQERAQDRAESGEQATQADANLAVAQDAIAGGVDVSIFGDFSEEALAKGIATLQAQMAQQMREQILSDVRKELEPLQRKEQQSAQDAHMQAIYSKHPDADEVVQSKEFADWAKSLPSIMQTAVDTALKDGTTQQVIEVFDAFKAGAGRATTTTQAFKPEAPTTTARKSAPISLSEIAGEPHRDSVQATLAVAGDNPAALLGAMENMTTEQIERLMNTV